MKITKIQIEVGKLSRELQEFGLPESTARYIISSALNLGRELERAENATPVED